MKMLIGLTGKTGSGKSAAAEIFRQLGAFVADCDQIAHQVLEDDKVKKKLCDAFSEKIIGPNGSVNRKVLGNIVFSDKDRLSTLNTIMHGEIIKRALDLCHSSGKDIAIIDGSELEASGIDEKCNFVVVMTADEKVRLARIMARDNISEEDALRRIKAQTDYKKDAIFIPNNGDENTLKEKITSLYNKLSGETNA